MGEPTLDMPPDQEMAELAENHQAGAVAEDLDVKVNDNEQTVVEVGDGAEQVTEKLSENEKTDNVGVTEGSETLLEKSVVDAGLVEVAAEQHEIPSVEVNEAEGDVAVAVGADVVEEPLDQGNPASENRMEIVSPEGNAVEVKSVEVADTVSPNGHASREMDVMEPKVVPKDNNYVTPLKEENLEGEFSRPVNPFTFDFFLDGYGSGTEEEQEAFIKELESFYKGKSMDFKPPKFYGETLNCLKLWRAVTKLGGYEQVTSCKLWRQVGESFKPPKTCTTVSWTFRNFYEKALLEYEKHKIQTGELQVLPSSASEPAGVDNQAGANQGSGSGRARRDAAARAMQGWHSQRLLGNGEVGDPIIKEKSQLKRKKGSSLDRGMKVARTNDIKLQEDIMVDDVGEPADWVKINMRRTKDCFEIYALVPGLLREEVQVQSDPAGRLIITGEPEQPDNPWGVTPFKKVITLPSRIDPHQTSAVVTLHGQLFIRAPFEQSDL